MPSYTFTSTANAVLLRGAKPVFVDVNLKDINLNPKLVEKKINKKTKAIIVVHYGGNSCDMKYFLKLKKKYNLFLIEDAAHGFLGKYESNFLGTVGDFGTFSFHETKNFVGGQCGALSINNSRYINRAKILLDKGTDRSLISDRKKYYSWKDVGSEFRSAELPAALLFSQLIKSKKIQFKREEIWNYYYKNFSIKKK
jgi:dTDP-4-amino-4,6-dideoxygalactose transaminase